MGSAPAFQFYASDWLASVSSMTLEERGAYITLLAWSWEHGPVPNDMKRIAAILGTHLNAARRLWNEVCRRWNLTTDGQWTNQRLEKVRAQQHAFSERQSNKGKAGAQARKEARVATTATAPAVTPATTGALTEGQPEPQPETSSPISDLRSPTPLRKERSEGEVPRAREERLSPEPPAFRKPGDSESGLSRRDGLVASMPTQRWQQGNAFNGRVRVTWGLHAELVAKLGGDQAEAGRRLLAWYPAVLEKYEHRPIGDDIFAFWNNEFAAWVGTVTSRPGNSRTGDSRDAGGDFLREKHGHLLTGGGR